ncbi:ABC transporter ATP-binding protein [Peptostreptococcus porci]|uniref:ABC transporter ATP-binding protein n=1 Tax=Peptostreptococcus porci TaxID=2652282 RepID=UPI002A7F3469|nr:ABC transporter ATP-binding protein [Peptostreptococcus porci]MDY4128743.1 ABC transporter ATP-binding protein [Peptostreptococcus porci]MDY5436534.1 ABC transporter ATP-binding protein [Peptostreptococcus porci]MDY5480048.1 ABC transporter ATP-binding protein [Peptostreptococcus porci]
MKNIVNSIKIIFSISKFYLFLVISSAFFSSVLQVTMVYSVKIIIDGLQNGDSSFLYSIIIFVFSISILLPFSNSFFSDRTIPILSNKIDQFIIKKIYLKYLNIDLNFFSTSNNYDLYYYAINNINVIKEIGSSIGNILTNSLSLLGIIGLFILYDFKLIFIVLFGSIISFILSLIKEKLNFNLEFKNIPYIRKLEYINRIFYLSDYSKEIRNNYSDSFLNLYDSSYKKLYDNIKKSSKLIIPTSFFIDFFKINTFLLIIYLLGSGVVEKKISIGVFSMSISGCQQMYSILESLFMTFPTLYSMSIKIEKIKKFFSIDNIEKNNFNVEKINKISLKNVSFKYNDNSNVYTLKNISLDITEDIRKIAIIGKNGCGKSTLLNIISGLYKQTDGQIYYNDISNEYVNLSFIRKHFYIVFQDYKFFSMSIKDNILLSVSNKKTDIEKNILNALKIVGLYDKITCLKYGLDTVISNEFEDEGENFSQGELQRLAIAKAIISDKEIIVLDEPFSFGDSEYQKNISNILDVLSKEKKIIVVTHNQDIISYFDKVYKLDGNNLCINTTM